MEPSRTQVIDIIVCTVLVAAGLTLAWLGDYRGRQIINLERMALENHEIIIRQNGKIIRLIKDVFPGPFNPTETLHGPGQNR